MERGEEGFGELVVAGGNTAKVLELVEEALDAIALTVEFLVEREHAASSRDRGG